jgi:multiple sugar transport system ATP-binding protein
MGDRVAVIKRGLLQQIASPEELYRRPVNVFTAGFIGAPAMNLVEAQLQRESGHLEVRFGGHRLRCPSSLLDARPALAAYEGGTVIVGVRPEHFEDAGFVSAAPLEQRMTVKVDVREALGSEVHLFFAVDSPGVVPEDVGDPTGDGGTADDRDSFGDRPSFVARVNASTKATPGDTVALTVDVDALQFFDADSGLAIHADRR